MRSTHDSPRALRNFFVPKLTRRNLDIDDALVHVLLHHFGRIIDRPTYCHSGIGICILLEKTEFPMALRSRVQTILQVKDTSMPLPEAGPVFCPGCDYLLANAEVLATHFTLVRGAPKRTSRCHSFQRQMDLLRTWLYLENDQRKRDHAFQNYKHYTQEWNPRRLLQEAGNAAYWARHCFLPDPCLQHCPWCSQAFPDVDSTSAHMQVRVVLGHHVCLKEFARPMSTTLCHISFVTVRTLSAGWVFDLEHRWFRVTLRWANMVRTLTLQEATFRMAWTRYWWPIFKGNQRLHVAGRQVYALLMAGIWQ